MSKSIFYKLLFAVVVIFIFSSCGQNNHKKTSEVTEINQQEYLMKGKSMAIATKQLLGKQLINAINTKGTAGALEFCNIKAIALTDSMSVDLNAQIKRVSDNYRNPENAANEQEMQYINQAKKDIEQNGSANPQIFEEKDKMIGYYPIVTNALCLQCHGNLETDIDEATQLALQKNYPNDQATGYGINELRGIWVIEMKK